MSDLKHENEICAGCVEKMKHIEELEKDKKMLQKMVQIFFEENQPNHSIS